MRFQALFHRFSARSLPSPNDLSPYPNIRWTLTLCRSPFFLSRAAPFPSLFLKKETSSRQNRLFPPNAPGPKAFSSYLNFFPFDESTPPRLRAILADMGLPGGGFFCSPDQYSALFSHSLRFPTRPPHPTTFLPASIFFVQHTRLVQSHQRDPNGSLEPHSKKK